MSDGLSDANAWDRTARDVERVAKHLKMYLGALDDPGLIEVANTVLAATGYQLVKNAASEEKPKTSEQDGRLGGADPEETSEVETPYSGVATVVKVYGDGTATVKLATGQYETYFLRQLTKRHA